MSLCKGEKRRPRWPPGHRDGGTWGLKVHGHVPVSGKAVAMKVWKEVETMTLTVKDVNSTRRARMKRKKNERRSHPMDERCPLRHCVSGTSVSCSSSTEQQRVGVEQYAVCGHCRMATLGYVLLSLCWLAF